MHHRHDNPVSQPRGPGLSLSSGSRPAATRSWIVAAFNRFVLGHRYEALSVNELSRRAGVGRSTFYEHFRDKDDVLRQALTPILTPLADAAVGRGDPSRVRSVLEHVAENRARTLEMLVGPTREHVERALADLILERAAPASQPTREPPPSDHALEAARLSGAQVAVILAWLRQPGTPCGLERVVRLLTRRSDQIEEAPALPR